MTRARSAWINPPPRLSDRLEIVCEPVKQQQSTLRSQRFVVLVGKHYEK